MTWQIVAVIVSTQLTVSFLAWLRATHLHWMDSSANYRIQLRQQEEQIAINRQAVEQQGRYNAECIKLAKKQANAGDEWRGEE